MSALAAGWSSLLELVHGLRHWRSVVRLRAHDLSTEEGRGAERHRRMFWSIFAGAAARGTNLLTLFIAVPATIRYLGKERFGMWMTISSLVAIFGFADLGLGVGLMTSIARAHGAGDREKIRRLISTSFFLLLAIACALTGASLVAAPFVDWARVYNVATPAAISEAGPATLVFLACNIWLLPLAVAEQTRAGFQSAFTHSLWIGLGNLASLAAVLVAIHLRAGLPWLVFAMSVGPTFAALGSFAALFFREQPMLRPAPGAVARTEARALFRAGLLFFALNVGWLFSMGSDNFVLSQIRGASAVAEYAVALRVFGIAPMLLMFVTTPLWPAYGEALARGEMGWIRRTLKRSLVFNLAAQGTVSLCLLFLGRPLIQWWVSAQVLPSRALLSALALWSVFQVLGHTTAMFLNAAHVLRFQVICAGLLAASALTLKIVFTHLFGTAGVVWGTALAYFVFMLLPLAWFLPRIVARIGASAEQERKAALGAVGSDRG